MKRKCNVPFDSFIEGCSNHEAIKEQNVSFAKKQLNILIIKAQKTISSTNIKFSLIFIVLAILHFIPFTQRDLLGFISMLIFLVYAFFAYKDMRNLKELKEELKAWEENKQNEYYG